MFISVFAGYISKRMFNCGDSVLGVIARILQPDSIIFKEVAIPNFCLSNTAEYH